MTAADTVLDPCMTRQEAIAALKAASDAFNLPYQAQGYALPMQFFELNEEMIRRNMRNGERVWYRGARVSNRTQSSYNKPTCTRRCDAVAVIVPL